MMNKDQIKNIVINNPISCTYPWCVEWIIKEVKKLQPNSTILEMGTFVGGTTRKLALANKDVTIHTVDLNNFEIFVNDPNFNFIRKEYNTDISVEDLFEIQKMHTEDCPNIILHTGHSRSLDIKNVNLVFIDADHSYNEVLKDLNYAWDIVIDNGFIFGDDVDSPEVYNALNKFSRDKNVEYTIYSKCFKIQKTVSDESSIKIRKEYEFVHPDFIFNI